MLQMQIKTVDLYRINKILEKYNVKASIVNPTIILEGDISDEFLDILTNSIKICSVQNFSSELSSEISTETSLELMEEELNDDQIEQALPCSIQSVEQYDLRYPEVKRGEVYMCDFGKPYGSEQGFCRYAIIVQNDDGNKYSPTTIVIACTTEYKKILPVHLSCVFSEDNMIDYKLSRAGSKKNIIMAEQIQTVDKSRLRKYIGRLKPEFMEMIQEKIDLSLDLK